MEREDLETKAKNLLRRAINIQDGRPAAFCAEGSNVDKEIEFLINNGYILQKKEYEITSKGIEYVSGKVSKF